MDLGIFFVCTIGCLALTGALESVQGFGLLATDGTEGDVSKANTVEESETVYIKTKGSESPSTDGSKKDGNINLENLLVANLKDQLSSDFGQELKEGMKQKLVKVIIQEIAAEIKEDIKSDRFDINTFIGDAWETKDEIKGLLKHAVVAEVLEDVEKEKESEDYKESNINRNKRLSNSEYKAQVRDMIDRSGRVDEESTSERTHNRYTTENTSTGRSIKTGLQTNMQSISGSNTKTPRSIRQSNVEHIAFSAYLDHVIDHVSVQQTVQFNHVLLNDGSAYNTHTGVFTVPEDGVYLFAVHFGSFVRKTELRLVVDDNHQVDASTEHVNNGQYFIQSGNVAIIRVRRGQSVWVETYNTNDGEIDSYDAYRETTFVGCLLYAD